MVFTGELYINGKDAWETWNAKIIDDSYNSLLLPANPKEYIENSNRSEDGTRVYIENPRLQERTIQLTFGLTFMDRTQYMLKYEQFVSFLQQEGVLNFRFTSLKRVYKFVLSDFVSMQHINYSCKLAVRLREINPADRDEIISTKVLGTTDNKILSTIADQAIKV